MRYLHFRRSIKHDPSVKVSAVNETLDNYASGKIGGFQKLQRLGADAPPYITLVADLSEPEINALLERLESARKEMHRLGYEPLSKGLPQFLTRRLKQNRYF